jgi:non-specific protein-tyrosine kinase
LQDTRRQVVIALRWLPLILIGALAAGALAYTFMSAQPKVYESTATLVVSPGAAPSVQDVDLAGSAAVRYADQAVSRSVAEAVIDELGLAESTESLLKRISTATTEDTLELAISARDDEPEAARVLALSFGNEMVQRVRSTLFTSEVRTADRNIESNKRLIRNLSTRYQFLQRKPNKTALDRGEIISLAGQMSALQRDNQDLLSSSSAFVRNLLEWVERPLAPETSVEPRPLYWTLLALVVGGMLAVGLAFVLEYLRHYNKVRDERDLEAATGLPTLGSVSERRGDIKRGDAERLVMLRYPRGGTAEAYRGLLTRVGFASGPSRTLMVASADASDGKSAVAANLALAYAEAGRNVILVDADYRAPRLHSFFGVRNDRGFTNVLVDYDVPLGWVLVPTAHPRLRLVPAGPPPPRVSAALGTRQVDALVTGLLQVADMVIFAGPAIAGSLDAAVLASHLQEVALVVPLGARADDAAEAARTLQGAEAEVVGTILYRRVRGAHKRSDAAPLPVASPGQAATWPAPPSPPRRIPAVVPKADPSAPTNPIGAAAPPAGPAAFPAASGNGQYRPPAATGATPAAATPPQSTSGPYATPFGQGSASPDR